MKQAASLKDVQIPVVIPGIRVNTTATDFATFGEMQLGRFDGKRWVPFGELLSGR
jgi:branched-chain amino acid transport system substrate-binding protein